MSILKWKTGAYDFRLTVESMKDIMVECWFSFQPRHVRMNNVDPEKAVLIEYYMNPPSESYTCHRRYFYFPLYVNTLHQIVRTARRTDNLEVMSNDETTLTFILKDQHDHQKSQHEVRRLNVAPYFRAERGYVETDTCVLKTGDLYRILHDIIHFSRHVTFTAQHDKMHLQANDELGTLVTYTLPITVLNIPYQGTYLTRFLEKFCKSRLRETIILRVKEHAPLTVSFELPDGHLSMSIASLL